MAKFTLNYDKSKKISLKKFALACTILFGAMPFFSSSAFAQDNKAHNIVIFIADGLRYSSVNEANTPTFYQIQKNGVDFTNSHSLYPTVTTVNASAIAMGHAIGDTGEFANSLYLGKKDNGSLKNQIITEMENDNSIDDANDAYNGNYLNEQSLINFASNNAYNTAIIGKEGPALIQDSSAIKTGKSWVFDDATGNPSKKQTPMGQDMLNAFKAANLEPIAPKRGANGQSGDFKTAGTKVANIEQQTWFTKVATDVVLPKFKQDNKPFIMLVWSRDPDGTQHNNGDSLNQLSPGINGPTSLAAVRNASDNLGAIIDKLKALNLYENTDIFVTADHGFMTISKQSKTSPSAKIQYNDAVKGFLPLGFLAIDISKGLNIPIHTTKGEDINLQEGKHPGGAAVLGDMANPIGYVVAGGGSDMIYLFGEDAKKNAQKITDFVAKQDYAAAVFANDSLGKIQGALSFSDIGLMGDALTPKPALYISFTAKTYGCNDIEKCGTVVSDTSLQQGQGMHGSLSRGETRNFMAAIGPDFKKQFKDKAPISNADIAPTIAKITGFKIPSKGQIQGRVISEALINNEPKISYKSAIKTSLPSKNGFKTSIKYQTLKDENGKQYYYYDSAQLKSQK